MIFCFCCLAFEAIGQEKNPLSVGPQFGMSRTSITNEYHVSWQKNYLLGFIFRLKTGRKSAVNLEVNYERKGIDSGHTPLGTGVTFVIHEYFNYATVGALYERKFNLDKGFYWQGGMYSASLKSKKNESQSDLKNEWDAGFLLRLGYSFNLMENVKIRFYVGKAHGIVNIDEDKSDKNMNRSYLAGIQVLIP